MFNVFRANRKGAIRAALQACRKIVHLIRQHTILSNFVGRSNFFVFNLPISVSNSQTVFCVWILHVVPLLRKTVKLW